MKHEPKKSFLKNVLHPYQSALCCHKRTFQTVPLPRLSEQPARSACVFPTKEREQDTFFERYGCICILCLSAGCTFSVRRREISAIPLFFLCILTRVQERMDCTENGAASYALHSYNHMRQRRYLFAASHAYVFFLPVTYRENGLF